MSKFDSLLNSLLEEVNPTNPSVSTAPATNNSATNAPNPTSSPASNQPSTYNQQQQQPKTNTPNTTNKPANLNSPEAVKTLQALAGTKTTADVTKILSDPAHQNAINGFLKNLTGK